MLVECLVLQDQVELLAFLCDGEVVRLVCVYAHIHCLVHLMSSHQHSISNHIAMLGSQYTCDVGLGVAVGNAEVGHGSGH